MSLVGFVHCSCNYMIYSRTFQSGCQLNPKKHVELTPCNGTTWHPNWKVQVIIITIVGGNSANISPENWCLEHDSFPFKSGPLFFGHVNFRGTVSTIFLAILQVSSARNETFVENFLQVGDFSLLFRSDPGHHRWFPIRRNLIPINSEVPRGADRGGCFDFFVVVYWKWEKGKWGKSSLSADFGSRWWYIYIYPYWWQYVYIYIYSIHLYLYIDR